MGFLKDLLLGSEKEKDTRKEKEERVSIRDYGDRKSVYDSKGHWVEDLRWNRETDRWDKLDLNGNVTGHVERNVSGDMVHTDYFERTTRVDKREGARTVGHYDSKGNKTGYTTKDYSNNLTKHTYLNDDKKKSESKSFLSEMSEITAEYSRKMEEIRKSYETEEEDDYESDIFYDDEEDNDDPYADEYDDEEDSDY